MSFDWNKFCEVGIHLLDYSDEEQYQRSAIGRFYYCCFNLIRDYYESTHKKYVPDKDTHSTLIEWLEGSVYDEENELSDYLKKLRRYRNNADYDSKFYYNNVSKSEKTFKDIMDLLQKLRINPVVPMFKK